MSVALAIALVLATALPFLYGLALVVDACTGTQQAGQALEFFSGGSLMLLAVVLAMVAFRDL